MKGCYRGAIEDCEQEENSLRKSLSLIQDIQTASWAKRSTQRTDRPQGALRRGAQMQLLRMWAMQLPLWVPSNSEKPPPLCGAIPAEPNYVAKVEDMVAALVKNTDSGEGTEEDENWILAKVFILLTHSKRRNHLCIIKIKITEYPDNINFSWNTNCL